MFQVGSYGGKLKYTISYVAGPRGTLLDDADVQIIVSVLLKRIQFVLHVGGFCSTCSPVCVAPAGKRHHSGGSSAPTEEAAGRQGDSSV